MIRKPSRVSTVIALVVLASGAQAGTIALHEGASDPTTEGWSAVGTFNLVSTGAVLDDIGSGFDAWSVDDNGTALGDVGWYAYDLTPQQIADATTFGWRLTTRMRIVNSPDPGAGQPGIGFDASPSVGYRNGTTSYQVHFGSQSDGDPIVHVATGIPAGVQAAFEGGGSGYHLYELLLDPLNGLTLSIDNAVILSNLAGFNTVTPQQVIFGAGSSCCTGQGNFNLVKFETLAPVPLPTALPLFGGALGLLGCLGWRRKRTAAATA